MIVRLSDLRKSLGHYIRAARDGKPILVTYNGAVIAQIRPPPAGLPEAYQRAVSPDAPR